MTRVAGQRRGWALEDLPRPPVPCYPGARARGARRPPCSWRLDAAGRRSWALGWERRCDTTSVPGVRPVQPDSSRAAAPAAATRRRGGLLATGRPRQGHSSTYRQWGTYTLPRTFYLKKLLIQLNTQNWRCLPSNSLKPSVSWVLTTQSKSRVYSKGGVSGWGGGVASKPLTWICLGG